MTLAENDLRDWIFSLNYQLYSPGIKYPLKQVFIKLSVLCFRPLIKKKDEFQNNGASDYFFRTEDNLKKREKSKFSIHNLKFQNFL